MGMYGKLASVDPADVPAMAGWGYEEMIELFESDGAVDLDKSWDVVFRLVGRLAETGPMLVDDPMPIGEELVYGPAMYIDAKKVADMADRLGNVDDAQLDAAWNSIELASTYPLGADIADEREWVVDNLHATAALFARAANAQYGILFAVL